MQIAYTKLRPSFLRLIFFVLQIIDIIVIYQINTNPEFLQHFLFVFHLKRFGEISTQPIDLTKLISIANK